MENLETLITKKWFDDYQIGMESRFEAEGFVYRYEYSSSNSVIVYLDNASDKTTIEINGDGKLTFFYTELDKRNQFSFLDCSEDDFHTMIAHAFIYLRDGEFKYHEKWYNNLKRIN